MEAVQCAFMELRTSVVSRTRMQPIVRLDKLFPRILETGLVFEAPFSSMALTSLGKIQTRLYM